MHFYNRLIDLINSGVLLLATVANDPAVSAMAAPLVVVRSAGRADHLQEIDGFLHFMDDCFLRRG